MKVYAGFLLIFPLSICGNLKAQQNILKPDQNPRYMESAQNYRASAGMVANTEGITLQESYKAYDWYEARLERREQRRYRHLHRFSDHRIIYYHRFPGYHNYRDAPFFRKSSRQRLFRNTLPYH